MVIEPNPVWIGSLVVTFPLVGVVGGGQLARMLAPPAVALGVRLRVLAESPDAGAAQVVPDAPVGAGSDLDALRSFAAGCDVVTFDHEHVPQPVLAALAAEGVVLRPGPDALRYAQDKAAMRSRLSDAGVPCPPWALVTSPEELAAFAEQVGWPVVLKTPTGGYDGKGVLVADDLATAEPWLTRAAGAPLLAEARVPFGRELAVLVARSPMGQAAVWPVVETVQADGICTEVLAPAPGLGRDLAARASATALKIAGDLDVTGVLAVEMFEVRDGDGRPDVMVNELAMRPHNSGHWTIEGAVTSQFEQHLRAVLDLPLGSTAPRARWSVMANVLGGTHPDLYPAYLHVMAHDPEAKVHVYGKEVRPGRKVGHVTVSGDDLDDVRARARHAADYLSGTILE
jgi:5-(carboxyamino)imidazole ribonucleotide synthase